MELKYGRSKFEFKLAADRVKAVLTAAEKPGLDSPLDEVASALENPIGTASLAQLLAKKQQNKELNKVVIVVNDVTRYTPYQYLLPPLLDKLAAAGIRKKAITFVIATGVHAAHSAAQNREIFGNKIVDNYNFIFHNCDHDLIELGSLSTGNILKLNRQVAEADFLITTGVILPHYMAGFSGGRKSILPGVAGRQTIQNNHAMMVKVLDQQPALSDNPISQEMFEAAALAGVDFILNVVTNSKREIVQVVAGDCQKAWQAGIATSAEMYHLPLQEKAEVAIVSSGGFPRDINIYQAQKALDHADQAVKSGGTIIWLAECSEGYGERTFKKWMDEAIKPVDNITRIAKGFLLGGHKAFAISKVALKKEIILISQLSNSATKNIFARKANSLQEAINYVEQKYNSNYSAYILPQGSLTVPVLDN